MITGAALRGERDLTALCLARLVSDAGDWLLMIALPVYVFGLTGSTLATSAVFAAEVLPALLLGSVAGVLVDRWDPRRTLVGVNLAQAVLLLPLLAVDGVGRLWLLVAVAVVQSCLARLAGPATFALVPALVPTDRLGQANSLLGMAENLARLLGSPLGGVVFELGGLPGVVLADALTFAGSAALITLVRSAGRRLPANAATPAAAGGADRADGPVGEVAGAPAGFVRSWLSGLRAVTGSRPLATVFLAGGIGQFAQGLFVVLFVVFVERALHGDGSAVGLLRGVQAVGAVLGGLALGGLARRLRPAALVGYGYLAFGVISLLTWNAPVLTTALGPYLVLFVLAGMPAVACTAGLLTVAQAAAPPTHLGRVAGAFEATTAALAGAGVLLAGLLGDRVGLTALLDGQAALYLLAGALTLALLGPAVRRPRPAGTAVPAGAAATTAGGEAATGGEAAAGGEAEPVASRLRG